MEKHTYDDDENVKKQKYFSSEENELRNRRQIMTHLNKLKKQMLTKIKQPYQYKTSSKKTI